ncbi:MAG: phage tail tape measure protein [Dehalobacterium sp.]
MEQDLNSINRQIEVQSSSWYKLGKSLEPIGQSMQDIGKKMESVGKDLTKKVTLPIVGIGAAAVKIGSDFQAEMSKVQAISGATGDDLEKLTEKAKEMGATTKFTASESAQALNYMAMAGWDTTQMMDGLEGVMMLAAASGENLASVSDIVHRCPDRLWHEGI